MSQSDSQQSVDPDAVLDMPLLRRDEPHIAGVIDDLSDEVERLRDIIGTLYAARGADAGALRAGIRAAFGRARAKTGGRRP